MRKTMKLVACLLVLIMLPLTAFAVPQATITVIPGDDLKTMDGIEALLSSLSFSFFGVDQSFGASLNVGGEPVSTMRTRATTDGLFVSNEVLGEKPLYVAYEDVVNFVKGALSAEGATDEELMQIDAAFSQFQMALALELNASELSATSFTEENFQASIDQLSTLFAQDPELVAAIVAMMDDVTFTVGDFTSDVRDAATMKVDLNITKEHLLALMKTPTMQDMMTNMILAEDPDDDPAEKLAEVMKVFETLEIEYPITFYTAQEGEVLVGMELLYNISGVDDGDALSVMTVMNYNQLSSSAGIIHDVTMDMTITETEEDGDQETQSAQMKISYLDGVDNKDTGSFMMYAEGTQITATYTAETVDDVLTGEVQLYNRLNAASLADLAASDRPLIGFGFEIKEVDDAILAPIVEATEETSLNFFKLSPEEQQAYIAGLQTSAMQVLMSILSALPPEAPAPFGM